MPRGTQAAVGLAGGLIGGLILAQSAKADFHSRLLTRAGQYELAVSEVGLQVTGHGDQLLLLRWESLRAWGADDVLFVAQDMRGNHVVLPRRHIPEPIFSMIVEICTITRKGAKRNLGRSSFRKWSEISTGEKIVRGAIYTVGVLVLLFALLVVVLSAGPN